MPFIKDHELPPEETEPQSPLLPSAGRDSSRLLQDLLEHEFADPQIRNFPPHFDPTKPHSVPEPSHIHSFIRKSPDSLKRRPQNLAFGEHMLVVCCETCRTHMSFFATLTSEGTPKCGTSESGKRLHHFHLESWTEKCRTSPLSSASDMRIEYGVFQCCQCPLALRIDVLPPVVPEYLVSAVKRRKTGSSSSLNILGRAKDQKSSLPTNMFGTLSKYVTDILDTGGNGGRDINISSDSPFARRMGLDQDIIRFMEYLGWSREENIQMLKPPQWEESLHRGRLRQKLLEGAEMELAQLAIDSGKEFDRSDKFAFEPNVTRAEADMARLMAAPWPPPDHDLRAEVYFRKSINLDNSINPSFAALGTVSDVSEATIMNSYTKQVADDPVNLTFYLECLQDIGSSLQNRKINQFAESQFANGLYTRFDLQKAYRTLGIDHPDQIDDDGVNAVFYIRCTDVPGREREFQIALDVIRHFRKSKNGNGSMGHSEKREMDAAEAYKRLRVTDDITDDQILAAFVSCRDDYPDERAQLTEALHVIGKARGSDVIRNHLSELNESQVAIGPLNRQMSLDEAYIILGVEGGAQQDDTAIMVAYNDLVAVQPDRNDEFKKAVDLIADHRDSIQLKTFLIDMASTPEKQKAGPGSATQPVGLENVAQTCYMNSLFQYYFTLKPLRDVILSYEEHEEGDLSEEELKKKQISKWELERSKRFIAQLRLLFQELITSNLAYIRPKEELVRLTLVAVKQEIEDEAVKRRQSFTTNASQSIMDSDVPDLIEIEDTSVPRVPVSSPAVNPTSGDNVPKIDLATKATNARVATEDTDYEFVDRESNDSGGVMSLTTSDPTSVDKENASQSQFPSSKLSTTEKSPLQESQQVNLPQSEANEAEDVEMVDLHTIPTPPQTPPSIPRRPRRRSTWGALKYGSQQDVTECITNCLSQFHAAFKADQVDANGEQIDLFKRLFYIRVKHVFRDLQATPQAKPVDEREELYGSMVPIYVDAEIGGSLYDAIDLALGREKIEYKGIGECEKQTTITYLPPVLQIQIVRTQFNRSVGAGYKENAHLELESKIYMDRYMEAMDSDLTTRRDDYWNWKVELEHAQRRKAELLKKVYLNQVLKAYEQKSELPLNPLELLSLARGFLERISSSDLDEAIPPELIDGLALYESHLKKQVDKLDKDIGSLKSRIKQQFTDRRTYGYRLHSVFIHRGDILHGHYWIYIYDFARNRWFKYNDEQVTEVDEKVVFADNSAEGSGPYFVTYVKEDSANDLVEAVKRDMSGDMASFVD